MVAPMNDSSGWVWLFAGVLCLSCYGVTDHDDDDEQTAGAGGTAAAGGSSWLDTK